MARPQGRLPRPRKAAVGEEPADGNAGPPAPGALRGAPLRPRRRPLVGGLPVPRRGGAAGRPAHHHRADRGRARPFRDPTTPAGQRCAEGRVRRVVDRPQGHRRAGARVGAGRRAQRARHADADRRRPAGRRPVKLSPAARARVEVVPFASEVAESLAAHDVFVLPSWFGRLPLSLLEAAAAGLACVTTATCGNLDVFRPESAEADGAILVTPGDHRALAEALERLMRDPELAPTWGCARASAPGRSRGGTPRSGFLPGIARRAAIGSGAADRSAHQRAPSWSGRLMAPSCSLRNSRGASLASEAEDGEDHPRLRETRGRARARGRR